MAKSDNKGMIAIGKPDARLVFEDRDTATISATEANPRPGVAIAADAKAMAVPGIVGGQDTDCDLYMSTGGFPGIQTASAGTIYKADTATQWRGKRHPAVVADWTAIRWETTYQKNWDMAVYPDTGEVLAVVSMETYWAGSTVTSHLWQPASPGAGFDGNTIYTLSAETLWDAWTVVLPSGRALAGLTIQTNGGSRRFDAYYSDDKGANWALYAGEILDIADSYSHYAGGTDSKAVMVGTDILWVRRVAPSGSKQYASNSLGTSFMLVDTLADSGITSDYSLMALPDGRAVIIYLLATGGNYTIQSRRVGSAWEPIWDTTAETVLANGGTQIYAVAAHVDDAGYIHVYYTESSADEDSMRHMLSRDGGDTWSDSTFALNIRDAGSTSVEYFNKMSSIHAGSREIVACTMAEDTFANDLALGAFSFGEWCEWTGEDVIFDTLGTSHLGMVPYVAELSNWGDFWGARVGTGAANQWTTQVTSEQDVAIRLTTTAETNYRPKNYGNAFYDLWAEGKVRAVSGGSSTADEAGLQLAVDDGADRYETELWLDYDNDQFVWAENATAIITVAWVWDTVGDLHFKLMLDSNYHKAYLLYRADGDIEWTVATPTVCTDTGTAGAGTNQTSVKVGAGWAGTAGTAVCDWRYLSVNAQALATGTFPPNDTQTTLRPFGVGGNGYPLPGIGPDTQIARLHVLAGPVAVGESYDIDTDADYPISACYPDVSPSPTVAWRSTGSDPAVAIAESIPWAFDFTHATSLGNHTLILGLFGCNLPSAVFQGKLGGGAWTTIGTVDFDADFSAVDYVLEGDMITADTAGTSGDRYIWLDELAGGWVELSTGGAVKYRKIRSNTEGEWTTTADATTRKARIWLDGIDGTESANSTCKIYPPSAIGVFHDVTHYDMYRIQIPTGNNADGYWKIGAAMVCGAHVPGQQPDFGWTWGRARNAETRTTRGGTTYTKRQGTAPRSVTMAWTGGVDTTALHASGVAYLAAGAGDPIGAESDVPWLLTGLVEADKSGETPLIVVLDLPTTDVTITDPTKYLYCRLASDITVTHVVGDEDTELYRIGNVLFEEIVG